MSLKRLLCYGCVTNARAIVANHMKTISSLSQSSHHRLLLADANSVICRLNGNFQPQWWYQCCHPTWILLQSRFNVSWIQLRWVEVDIFLSCNGWVHLTFSPELNKLKTCYFCWLNFFFWLQRRMAFRNRTRSLSLSLSLSLFRFFFLHSSLKKKFLCPVRW